MSNEQSYPNLQQYAEGLINIWGHCVETADEFKVLSFLFRAQCITRPLPVMCSPQDILSGFRTFDKRGVAGVADMDAERLEIALNSLKSKSLVSASPVDMPHHKDLIPPPAVIAYQILWPDCEEDDVSLPHDPEFMVFGDDIYCLSVRDYEAYMEFYNDILESAGEEKKERKRRKDS